MQLSELKISTLKTSTLKTKLRKAYKDLDKAHEHADYDKLDNLNLFINQLEVELEAREEY